MGFRPDVEEISAPSGRSGFGIQAELRVVLTCPYVQSAEENTRQQSWNMTGWTNKNTHFLSDAFVEYLQPA
jgi:hypothetical protein